MNAKGLSLLFGPMRTRTAWGNVQVCAHHADAPFLRSQAPGPPPDLADWEPPSSTR